MASDPVVLHESAARLERWSDPVRGEVRFRTLFGDDGATDSLTMGVAEMEPGDWLGHHRHAPSEVYYVVAGEGTVVLAGREHPVRAGSAVFIPGDVEHGVRNTGPGPLRFVYGLAVGSFADIDYQFCAPR